MKNLILIISSLFLFSFSHAEVIPNFLFSNNMILQRDASVPVWGSARDGERVTVSFNGQKVSTTTTNGQWMIRLKPLKAGGPYTMTILGENTITRYLATFKCLLNVFQLMPCRIGLIKGNHI